MSRELLRIVVRSPVLRPIVIERGGDPDRGVSKDELKKVRAIAEARRIQAEKSISIGKVGGRLGHWNGLH